MQKQKVRFVTVLTSFIIGVGVAWMCSGAVSLYVSESMQPATIAIIAITGDKFGSWLLYKFNFDRIGEALTDMVIRMIKRK